jgi:hypothetical protein
VIIRTKRDKGKSAFYQKAIRTAARWLGWAQCRSAVKGKYARARGPGKRKAVLEKIVD